jgi:hypothetical protein
MSRVNAGNEFLQELIQLVCSLTFQEISKIYGEFPCFLWGV